MIGLFDSESPQGLPAGCAVVHAPGPFSIETLPAGSYRALSVCFPMVDVLEAVLLDRRRLLVGRLADPIHYDGERGSGTAVRLELRAATPTDPPIVLAAPLMLAERAVAMRRRQARPREVRTASAREPVNGLAAEAAR